MLDWIAANLATILICALLILIVFLIVRYLLRQKKAGKNSCGAECAHCARHGECHGTHAKYTHKPSGESRGSCA